MFLRFLFFPFGRYIFALNADIIQSYLPVMYTKIRRRNCTYYRCDLWMVSRIWSCSVAPTPMLSRASRVPQSGQISVVPSVLDKAGGAAYLSPHRGHIRIRSISLFMSCHLHRFYLCFGKVVLIKSEADIPLKACAYIGKGRYSYLPFFMHDIHKALPSPYLSVRIPLMSSSISFL